VTEEQRSTEEIREDIEQTRKELGDAAAAVAQKADVKKQAKAKASGVKEKASAKADSIKQTATAKREEVAEKASDSTGTALEQTQRFAQQNRAALAIGGAFIAGFALGKLRSR
jgi:phage repressor protein C with HTH and peptisase S24 domain